MRTIFSALLLFMLILLSQEASAQTPEVTISGNNAACQGIPLTFKATVTNGGSPLTYRWYVNGNLIQINGTPINGMLGFYPFDGNSQDASGNAHHGTNYGAALTTDRFGRNNSAYSFNGSSNYIEMADNANFRPQNLTVCAWTKFNAYPSGFRQILAKNAGYGPHESLGFNCHDNNVLMGNIGGPNYYGNWLQYSFSVNLNTWYFFAYSFRDDANSHTLYLNGNPVNSGTENSSITYDGQPWSIGSEKENGVYSWFFNGKLDDIMIFNRALTSQEIQNLYYSNDSTCTFAPNPGDVLQCIITTPTGYSDTSNAITMNMVAAPVPTISGSSSGCINSTGNIYSTESGMTDYAWTVSGGTFTGQGTNSITVSWTTAGTGIITVTYKNNAGCAAVTPTQKNVTVYTLPATPVLTGLSTICTIPSAGNIYSTESGMSNYLWTVSSGGSITSGGGISDNTVTITWNTAGTQTVSVTYTDSHGCSPAGPGSLNIIVNPEVSVTISADNTVCTGDIVTFSSSVTNGGTNPVYRWYVNGQPAPPSVCFSDDMLGFYPFNGNANDESGNGHNGTVYGATLTADRFGTPNRAYSFNGYSNYIEIPDNLNFRPQNFSVCAWGKFVSYNGIRYFVSKNAGNSVYESISLLYYNNGTLMGTIGGPTYWGNWL